MKVPILREQRATEVWDITCLNESPYDDRFFNAKIYLWLNEDINRKVYTVNIGLHSIINKPIATFCYCYTSSTAVGRIFHVNIESFGC